MKTEIKKILYKFLQDGISSDDAAQQVLDLFDINTRTFNVGDNVRWRGMNLIVVAVGIGEILIATSKNVEDENYNDWWVGTQYVC